MDSELYFPLEVKHILTLSTESNSAPLIPRLLPILTQILLSYPKDPAILASLSLKLLKYVPFTQALTLASEEALILALKSPAPSANLLALTIIHKAIRSPGDTAILSIMQGVILQYITTWLSTPHVEIGERATQALGDLLEVDCDHRNSAELTTKLSGLQLSSRMPPGQGLLWRRVFQDRQIYEKILELCSPKTTGDRDGQLDERQKSLAQGRLLRVLPRLAALDFAAVTHSKFGSIEADYGLTDGEEGLLPFAALHMVDKKDMLMHYTLIDFVAELLRSMSMTDLSKSKLDYLANMTKEIAGNDRTMYQTLERLAVSPETPPELAELLAKLNEYL
jgi:hypothetical protein